MIIPPSLDGAAGHAVRRDDQDECLCRQSAAHVSRILLVKFNDHYFALPGQGPHAGSDAPPSTAANSTGSPVRTSSRYNRDRQDRKSTRLNSSHGYISYAVFCLKKKKKKH